MKFNPLSFLLLVLLMAATTIAVSGEVLELAQIEQAMLNSTVNLTTYSYSRFAETTDLYSNQSVQTKFAAVKTTEGKVDLVNKSGYFGSRLTDAESGKILLWEGYFINGSEYQKEGENWTNYTIIDPSSIMADYNEIPGQVDLIDLSNMMLVGSERLEGESCYKLVGSPDEPIRKGMIGLQLLASYFPSPFPMPEELRNLSFDIDKTELLNNSNIVLTAWISESTSLLRRLDINSSLTITPQILKVQSEPFMIQSWINETTVYRDFGHPIRIELPLEAIEKASPFRFKGADWRWATFGTGRP
jgi:hypothetical protein